MQRRFDRRKRRELEELLRTNRPEPRSGFLETMVARVVPNDTAARRRTFSLRLGLAAGFAVVFLVAVASSGALGHSGSATPEAVKGPVGMVGKTAKTDQGTQTATSAPTAQRPKPSKNSASAGGNTQSGSAASSDGGVSTSGAPNTVSGRQGNASQVPAVLSRSLAHSLHASNWAVRALGRALRPGEDP